MTTTEPALTAESTSKFVDTAKFRVHYHEAGTGHPVVLLHGSGPGATGWINFEANIEPLSRDFRVIAPDMPGWGESDTQTAETGSDHAQVLVEMLDALGIEKAALVGNSMGGMTAITAAIRFPERVSHLITMGAPSPGANLFSATPSEGLKILFGSYLDPSNGNFKQLVSVMCFDQAMATDELAASRAEIARAHPEHLASFVEQQKNPSGMAAFFSLGPRLPEITAPTMAVHGRDDRTVHYENSLRTVALVENSRLVLFNRCGHWAQLEHAAEFNRLVTQFVQSQ